MTAGKINFNLDDELSKHSASFLEQIINNSPLIYFILDDKGNFLASRGKGLQEIESFPDKVVGSNIFEMYKDKADLFIAVQNALNGQVSYYTSYIKDKDRFYRTTLHPIKQHNKNYVLGITVDETMNMRTQRELINKEKNIQNLKKLELIGRIGSGLTHEFNNLLQSIISYTELLDDQISNEMTDAKETLNKLKKATKKGKDITYQLLKENLQVTPKKVKIEINNFLHNLLSDENFLLTNKKIKLILNLSAKPIEIFANEDQLKIVFSNLMSNSYDAISQEGEIVITTEIDQKKARIKFMDTGGGIPEENLKNMFELFYTTKKEGIGIGLVTVKSIISQFQGSITVKNQSKGALFIIELPLLRPEISLENILNQNISGKTIIIIDDEIANIKLIELFIKDLNCKIFSFTSALEAEKFLFTSKLNNENIDLIITDIMIPNFSGLDLYENLKNDEYFRDTFFLFVSGYDIEFVITDPTLLTDKTKFISKPIDKEFFISTIRNLFSLKNFI